MHVNISITHEVVELQILVPAHDYCITALPSNEGPQVLRRTIPQIFCAVSSPLLFLVEGQGRNFSQVILENILRNDTCLTIVSFVTAPFEATLHAITPLLDESNVGARMMLEKLGRSSLHLSVHFDFLFHPAFRNRPDFLQVCRQSEGLELCLCKSATLWTRESGPIFLHRQRFEPSQLMSEAKSTISLPDDVSLVL